VGQLIAVEIDEADQVAIADLVAAAHPVLGAAGTRLEDAVLQLHLGAAGPGSLGLSIAQHGAASEIDLALLSAGVASELVHAAGVFVTRALDRLGERPGHLVHEAMRAGASLLVEIRRDAVRLYLCRWNQKLELLAALISRVEHTPVVATKTD
jgi:hypothetical protein